MDIKGAEKKKEGEEQKKSPFDLIFSHIQRKTSEKGRSNIFQVKRFFKGFDKEATENEKNEQDLDSKFTSGELTKDNASTGPVKEEDVDSETSAWWKVTQFMEKFGKKAEIHFINLNNCGLTSTDIKELGTLMPFLPDIEEIDLSWNDLIGGSLKFMTPHFNHIGGLRILNLSNCYVTGDDTTALGDSLQYIAKLQVLDLSWNNNLGGTLSRLTRHLAELHELKSLILTECGFTAEDAASLGSSFQYWPFLRKLDLSCNKAAGGGFKESAAQLTSFKQLELLDIHQCGLSGEDVTALTQVIPLLSNLQVLDISSNKAIGLSPEHLFSRLRFLPKLKSVNASNCSLRKESFAGLAEASRYLTDLQMLDLSWNKCIGGNLKLLIETLRYAIVLQSLLLSSCNLVTQDIAVLASAAQAGHLDTLEQLDLAYNDTVPDEGWSLLFESAPALKNLVELDISLRPASTRECGPWFIHLLSNMAKLPKLKELGMQRWALSSAEQQQLDRMRGEKNINIHYD